MSATQAPQLVLATGETITLTADEADQLTTAIQKYRSRTSTTTRSLVREIQAFLERNPASSTTDIARGIRARDTHVRHVLTTDSGYKTVPARPGSSTRPRIWIVAPSASQPGPNSGTSTSAARNGNP